MDTRHCRRCLRELPLDEFRLRSRETGRRHAECRECRRGDDRRRRASNRRTGLVSDLRELRRCQSVDRAARFVESMIARLGGPEQATAVWLDAMQAAPNATARLVAHNTLLHVATLFDEHQLRRRRDESPETFVRQLHHAGRLQPILAGMFGRGELGLDDLDPPPVE